MYESTIKVFCLLDSAQTAELQWLVVGHFGKQGSCISLEFHNSSRCTLHIFLSQLNNVTPDTSHV
jgi:hypothetical protein